MNPIRVYDLQNIKKQIYDNFYSFSQIQQKLELYL